MPGRIGPAGRQVLQVRCRSHGTQGALLGCGSLVILLHGLGHGDEHLVDLVHNGLAA